MINDFSYGEFINVKKSPKHKNIFTYKSKAEILNGFCDKKITGIYFLIQDEKIVYIGQSLNIINRIHTHVREGSKKFQGVIFCSLRKHLLDSYESFYIFNFTPKYNKNCGSHRDRYFSIKNKKFNYGNNGKYYFNTVIINSVIYIDPDPHERKEELR